jgi:hypothetical protein
MLNNILVFHFKESGISVTVREEEIHRKQFTELSPSLDKNKVGSMFCCFSDLFAYIFCIYFSILLK